MNTPTIFNLGPHMYKFTKDADGTIHVSYNLYGVNGTRGKPRPGHPNEHGWVTSRHPFDDIEKADAYARRLLRPVFNVRKDT